MSAEEPHDGVPLPTAPGKELHAAREPHDNRELRDARARRRRTSRLMRRLVMAVQRYTGRTARAMTMPMSDVQAMGVLVDAGEALTATELGHHLGLSRPAVSAMLHRLVQGGYVRRSGSSDDGRRVMVAASRTAQDQSAERFQDLNQVLLQVLADNPDLAPAFIEVLSQVTEAFEGLDKP